MFQTTNQEMLGDKPWETIMAIAEFADRDWAAESGEWSQRISHRNQATWESTNIMWIGSKC